MAECRVPRTDDSHYFADLRRREFARLDASAETYLDYTGAALHADSLVVRHADWLRRTLLGNPHSESAPSRAGTAVVEAAKAQIEVLRGLGIETGLFVAPNATHGSMIAPTIPKVLEFFANQKRAR